MQSELESQPTIPLEFTGNAKEYFGIWIINILLIIATLGIYSPWAKVRNHRYFYGNTILNGAGFDYLASPIAILKGWAIAAVLLAIYFGFSSILPPLQLAFGIAFLLALPWLVVKAMRFRLHNTAYRNIRFNFAGDYGKAIGIYTGLLVAMPFTLGMIYPFYMHRQTQFIVDNSQYGRSSFKFLARAGDFYAIYMMLLLVFVVITAVIGGIITALAPSIAPLIFGPSADQGAATQQIGMLMQLFLVPLMLSVYLFAFSYTQSRIGNLTWNNLQLDQHRFKSTLTTLGLMGLYLTNILAIIFSLGLATPWAKVRTIRYRIGHLSFMPHGDLDNYVQGLANNTSAIGEQIGDAFDFDIGI